MAKTEKGHRNGVIDNKAQNSVGVASENEQSTKKNVLLLHAWASAEGGRECCAPMDFHT